MTVEHAPALGRVAVALAVLLLAGLAATGARANGPLSHDGRWITDARGRVVTLHGVNEVTKKAPFSPAGDGFGRDDARFLSENGFNLVRVGVEFQGLMPEPGRIDWGYVNSIGQVVRDLTREHVYVLLDFHQDGYGPGLGDNGFPAWMQITDGLPNPNVGFPAYYVANPALQRAFENFYANRPGPGGIGLQDYFVQGLRAIVGRFAYDPRVLGYELLNEPWPGADWAGCFAATGCPAIEQARLRPFYAKATEAVRRITRRQQVFVEPFSTFNFGGGPTTLPGVGSNDGLATHSYAGNGPGEASVRDLSIAAAERDDSALLVTEFGATGDPLPIRRLLDGFDARGVSWAFWAYNENLIVDRTQPASLDALRSPAAFRALVQPYPVALTGTPGSAHFDPATGAYTLGYSTAGPGGRRYPWGLESVLSVPKLQYPDGYSAKVSGARVTSRPCAERLTLRSWPWARSVSVTLDRGGTCR
jgi:endoglycosylceramidase